MLPGLLVSVKELNSPKEKVIFTRPKLDGPKGEDQKSADVAGREI